MKTITTNKEWYDISRDFWQNQFAELYKQIHELLPILSSTSVCTKNVMNTDYKQYECVIKLRINKVVSHNYCTFIIDIDKGKIVKMETVWSSETTLMVRVYTHYSNRTVTMFNSTVCIAFDELVALLKEIKDANS